MSQDCDVQQKEWFRNKGKPLGPVEEMRERCNDLMTEIRHLNSRITAQNRCAQDAVEAWIERTKKLEARIALLEDMQGIEHEDS